MKISKLTLLGLILPALVIVAWLSMRFWPVNDSQVIDGGVLEEQNSATSSAVGNDLEPVAEQNNDDLFKLTQPEAGSIVTSPLVMSGQARGTWFFEASFPIRLEDASGNLIASTIGTASGDWMTEDFVPFLASLEFVVASDTEAVIIFQKDNPSDMREYDREVRVPVILKATKPDQMTVKVYFTNNILDPEVTCQKVFAVERQVTKTAGVARAALEELLKGASESEQVQGYSSNLNAGITINSLKIDGQTAYVDFDKQMEEGMGGSCRTAAIRAQIIETLRQFPTISEVVISVEGRTEDILQP